MSGTAVGVEYIHGLLRRTMPPFTLNQGRLRLAGCTDAAQGHACRVHWVLCISHTKSQCSLLCMHGHESKGEGWEGTAERRRGERRKETGTGPRRKERGECSETETEQESYTEGWERKRTKRKRNTASKNGCNSGKVDAVIWRDRYRDLAWNAVICIWHPETTPNQTRTTTTRTNRFRPTLFLLGAVICSNRCRDL